MSKNEIFFSKRLLYRPYQIDDVAALVKLCNEKTYRRWFYFLPRLNEKRAREQIEKNIAMWSREIDITKDQFIFAVVEKKSSQLIGSVGVSRYHGKKRLKNFEVGYDIGEDYQNKGFATEATKEIVKWAIPKLIEARENPRIIGKAEHKNFASRKVLENAVFRFHKKELFCHVYEISE